MFQAAYKKIFRRKRRHLEIAPEDIFIDSSNLPHYDTARFEGRFERAIPEKTIFLAGIVFVLIGFIFAGRWWTPQVNKGEAYAIQSEQNRLRHVVLFPERGLIHLESPQTSGKNKAD